MERSHITLILAFFLCILLNSCKDESVDFAGINGDWEWTHTTTSGSPLITPQTAGFTIDLVIDDFYFKEYLDDSLIFVSQYDLVIRADSLNKPEHLIIFESGYEQNITINETEMKILDPNWIPSSVYTYNRK